MTIDRELELLRKIEVLTGENAALKNRAECAEIRAEQAESSFHHAKTCWISYRASMEGLFSKTEVGR